MPGTEDFDVVIVGASLAGCSAAILLGRQGFTVALVDKHGGADAFKRLCGHFIQASATPTIERLGMDGPIEAAGGVRNGIDVWTGWGVICSREPLGERRHGFSLRRKKLDPLIRRAASDLPTVDYRPRLRAVGLDRGSTAPTVEFEGADGTHLRLRGRLVVGADGRASTLARLARVQERRSRNNRFCYAAYFSNVGLHDTSLGRMWLDDRDVVIAAPQDEGLTVLATFPHKRELPRFEEDRRSALMSTLQDLPGLDLTNARQEDKILGYKSYDLIRRAPTCRPGIALVGDAALASDPVMAVGCGWAIESAGWLVDSVTPALEGSEPLSAGLGRYRRLHRRNLRGHHLLTAMNARARPIDPLRRMLFSAGASDPVVAQRLIDFGERSITPRELLSPAIVGRSALHMIGSRRGRSQRELAPR